MASEQEIYFETQIGNLVLGFKRDRLVSLLIEKTTVKPVNLAIENHDKLISSVFTQLAHYFSSVKSFHNISLAPQGTAFQKSVWHELSKIPAGEIRTYGEIASKLNTSPRAVGNACRKNPIQIIVPCHRVVSANGIGGYAGKTEGRQLKIKQWLLRHEGVCL